MLWDLEFFVGMYHVSTFFTFDYVHIWHGVYKWLGKNTTKIFFGKMLKFIYAFGLRIILHTQMLMHSLVLNNWIMWRLRPSARLEREDNHSHMRLVLGWWIYVLFEPSTNILGMNKKEENEKEGDGAVMYNRTIA